jgi:large subunit ribosomal protein L10
MATEAKAQAVGEFEKIVGDATGVVLTDFTGLDVAAVSDLRRRCRAAGVQYRVIKNTLAKRAITATPMEPLGAFLAGANAWAVHKTDQVAAAKVLSDFAKDHEKLRIRAGYVDGRVVSVKEIEALAKLPSREILLSQVVGAMQGPMVGFAGAMTALLRNFAGAVDAYAKKRAETGA